MSTKRKKSIDLNYRPSSYFWARDLGVILPSNIKGAERRRLYLDALSGEAGEPDPRLSQHALNDEDRRALGSIHPAFMGGEYLPDTRPREVEIARITIASTTQDVTCVYARQVGKRIHYRVVDEYDGETLSGAPTRTSNNPLTLEQLVDFFLGAWDLLGVLEMNFVEWGNYDPDEVKAFIVDATSSFYDQFDQLIDMRVDAWLDHVSPDEDDDEDG